MTDEEEFLLKMIQAYTSGKQDLLNVERALILVLNSQNPKFNIIGVKIRISQKTPSNVRIA